MFGYLVILFTVLPAIELMLLIEVGSRIGSANTIFLILLTGVAGAYFARLQGYLIIQKIQQSMNQGQMPTDAMLDGLMVFGGGILLLTPGFITDTIGFLLLFPWSRALIKRFLRYKFEQSIHQQHTTVYYRRSVNNRGSDYEDADFR